MRALVLALLLAPVVAAAQGDPLEWTVARDLRAKVEASRTIAAATRERLLTVFDGLARAFQRHAVSEQSVARMMASVAQSREQQRDQESSYRQARSAWSARRADFNRECERSTSSSQSEIDRCNERRRELREEETQLELRRNQLDQRQTSLRGEERELENARARLAEERRAWAARIEPEFSIPARDALAR
jgi:chromosome segregation ATPase